MGINLKKCLQENSLNRQKRFRVNCRSSDMCGTEFCERTDIVFFVRHRTTCRLLCNIHILHRFTFSFSIHRRHIVIIVLCNNCFKFKFISIIPFVLALQSPGLVNETKRIVNVRNRFVCRNFRRLFSARSGRPVETETLGILLWKKWKFRKSVFRA